MEICVLSEIRLSSITDSGEDVNLELFDGEATAEQEGYPIILATDGNPATGWAINQAGRVSSTAVATWNVRVAKEPNVETPLDEGKVSEATDRSVCEFD